MCSGSFVRPPICQKIMFFVELFLLENKTKECLGYRNWFLEMLCCCVGGMLVACSHSSQHKIHSKRIVSHAICLFYGTDITVVFIMS